jgi:hypothetical protein
MARERTQLSTSADGWIGAEFAPHGGQVPNLSRNV